MTEAYESGRMVGRAFSIVIPILIGWKISSNIINKIRKNKNAKKITKNNN